MEAYEDSCLPALEACTSTTGEVAECRTAEVVCGDIDYAFQSKYFPDSGLYDIRQSSAALYPPDTYATYLADPEAMTAIGAVTTYIQCSDAGDSFMATSDIVRSFLPALSAVVQSGISVLIWAVDADAVCDWFGGLAATNAIQYTGTSAFVVKDVVNYTVDGVIKGTFKNVDNLSWLRVFESVHEVPYFQAELALQIFKQMMQKKPIDSS